MQQASYAHLSGLLIRIQHDEVFSLTCCVTVHSNSLRHNTTIFGGNMCFPGHLSNPIVASSNAFAVLPPGKPPLLLESPAAVDLQTSNCLHVGLVLADGTQFVMPVVKYQDRWSRFLPESQGMSPCTQNCG